MRTTHDWDPDRIVTCSQCGHTGKSSSDIEEALVALECKRCGHSHGFYLHPTDEKTRELAAQGNTNAIASLPHVEQRQAFLQRAEQLELRTIEQFAIPAGNERLRVL